MQRLFLLPFLLLCCPAIAQQPKTTNQTTLVKVIPAKAIKGKDYSLSIEVKNATTDPLGEITITVLPVGKSDWDFIHEGRVAAKVKGDTTWQQLALKGKVDAAAEKLWVYMITNGNGDFFFDNIRLELKTDSDHWQDIEVANGDFEQSSSSNPLRGLENTKAARSVKGNTFFIEQDADAARNQVLHLHAEGGVRDTSVIYGYSNAGKFVNSNGARIYYEMYGKGEPLLLLHGNGGSIADFATVIPVLAKQYKVIAVDTRAQGWSTNDTTQPFTYELFAGDMKNLLDTLGLQRVNVLGWSDGGIIGLLLASKYPGYVGKLVALGANLNPSDTCVAASMLNQIHKDIKKLEKKNDPKDATVLKLMKLMLEEPHIDPAALQSIRAKTLIMAGEKDVILEKHTRLIAASIPNATLKILKGQTHWVVTEDPALLGKEVLDFLSQQ